MISTNFYKDFFDKISVNENRTALSDCLNDILKFLNLKNINSLDIREANQLNEFGKEIGIFFNAVSVGSLDELDSIHFPVLIQFENLNEYGLLLPSNFKKYFHYDKTSKSLRKIKHGNIKIKQAWQCQILNSTLPTSFISILSLIINTFKKEIALSCVLGLVMAGLSLGSSLISGYLFSNIQNLNQSYFIYLPLLIFIISTSICSFVTEFNFRFINFKVITHIMPSLKIIKKGLEKD